MHRFAEKKSPGKGRGLYAVDVLGPGELVLCEVPSLSMQLPGNTATGVRACAHCLRLVGAMDFQLQHIAGWDERPVLPVDAEEMDLGGFVACGGGCGALYCSQRCAQAAWALQHKVLCTGHATARRRRALAQFEEHAHENHEGFLFAARAVAAVLCAFEANGSNIQSALAPFAVLCGAEWWRGSAEPGMSPSSAASSAAPQGQREAADWATTAESLRLLLLALPDHPALQPTAARGASPWLDHAFFSKLVGKLRLNTVCVDIHNVTREFADALRAASAIRAARAPGGAAGRACAQPTEADRLLHDVAMRLEALSSAVEDGAGSHDWASESSDASDGSAMDSDGSRSSDGASDEGASIEIPNVVGTALCSTVACCNHSCEPNIEVRYGDCHDVQLWTTRAVAAGDELFISYIENETLSFQQRRMALREYGFTCQCARCQHESGESDE